MVSDLVLIADVERELRWEPTVIDSQIGVAAREGVVTLSGHVSSYPEKRAAVEAAQRVYGVRAVADELDVLLAGAARRTDEAMAAACLDALKAHMAVPDQNIKVVVRGGRVIMEGQVEWQYQKDALRAAVGHLVGVTGVSNHIAVTPHASPTEVKEKIEAALRRSAEVDARRVAVEAVGGKVTLRGSVRSFAERNDVQRAAWAAPGVTAVENNLTVTP